MKSKLLSILLGAVLLLAGCVKAPVSVDGVEQPWEPDYAMIEFGAVAAFTIIINETEVADEVVLQAHRGLVEFRDRLQCVGEACQPMGISLIESQIKAALPIEYQALGVQGARLARSRIAQYINTNQVDIVPDGVTQEVLKSIVEGAILAFEPHVQRIQGAQ